MRKEYIISVELDNELENALYNIRWKHIDIDALIQEELEGHIEGHIEGLIRAYGIGFGEVK